MKANDFALSVALYLTCAFLVVLISSCGTNTIQRVPPKTEFYYTGKESPCAKSKEDDAKDSIPYSVDGYGPAAVPDRSFPVTEEPGDNPPDDPTEGE